MWVLGNFVFLCTFLAPRIQGQTSGLLDKPNEYLAGVVDALWVKIKEHGISNLPVLDTSIHYNYTGFGVELVGPISFEDGFVQDIDLVSLDPHGFTSGAPLTHSRIAGRVAFANLRVYRDFRADLTTGMKIGSIVFTPTTFSYDLAIQKLHDNDTIVPTLSLSSYTALQWDIIPDDLETRLTRRQFANQTLLSPIRPSLIATTAGAWVPIFTEYLNEIIMKMGFPDLIF